MRRQDLVHWTSLSELFKEIEAGSEKFSVMESAIFK